LIRARGAALPAGRARADASASDLADISLVSAAAIRLQARDPALRASRPDFKDQTVAVAVAPRLLYVADLKRIELAYLPLILLHATICPHTSGRIRANVNGRWRSADAATLSETQLPRPLRNLSGYKIGGDGGIRTLGTGIPRTAV
jgi:hypothetical protein